MSTEVKKKRRVRRSSVRRGPTEIPEHLIPENKKLRFVLNTPVNISRRLDMGYSVCNAKSPEYAEIAALIGDRTLADGLNEKTSRITKLGRLGSESILMEIDLDLYLEGRKEINDIVDRRESMTKGGATDSGIKQESYNSEVTY